FLPAPVPMEVDVVGTEGRAYAWNDVDFRIHRNLGKSNRAEDVVIRPAGASPTVEVIREIIRELETGQRTAGNVDTTLQTVEIQFGIVDSHFKGGARVELPIKDRSLYVPGG